MLLSQQSFPKTRRCGRLVFVEKKLLFNVVAFSAVFPETRRCDSFFVQKGLLFNTIGILVFAETCRCDHSFFVEKQLLSNGISMWELVLLNLLNLNFCKQTFWQHQHWE